ncbi:MAG TPA: cytochrome c peroxidase [Gammaproteobacteria bacterium]|nr:cytochrome c peroxidase [Gammaproteobacteria bacterium]
MNHFPVAQFAGQPTFRFSVLHPVNFDASLGGKGFIDPDGDPLTYRAEWAGFQAPADGLTISGAQVTGVPTERGGFTLEVMVSDGRGGETSYSVLLGIGPNQPPELGKRNFAFFATAGAHVNYDPSQGGLTFEDPDGDALTYEVVALSPPLGLSVQGARVVGSLSGVGVMHFKVTALDGFGGSAEDTFSIAVAAPEPGLPTLPTPSYVYEDHHLSPPLPRDHARSRENFSPLWDTTPRGPFLVNPTTDAGATLGRVLFYDKRLSVTNTRACASCHHQERGFASAERFDTGVLGVPLKRNTMGLTNVRFNLHDLYFTDLRARGLEKLALMPIVEPSELGNYLPLLEAKIAAAPFYRQLFEAAFGSPEVTSERISLALAQFLRSLISYRTKFDGAVPNIDVLPDPSVFSPTELEGAELFRQNCSLCHFAIIQTLDVPANNGIDEVVTDPGAGGGTFRAASLHNIALTAPYMHDGRFATLREVIDHYDSGVHDSAHHFLRDSTTGEPRRLNLTDAQKAAFEAFFATLTDDEFLNDPRFSDPFAP